MHVVLTHTSRWDYGSSVPEVMRALDDVVRSGKVLYLGISDTPAWIVAKANEYARCNALSPFVVYQGEWSCMKRDFERDILPMCHAEGMGIAPFGVIAGGRFQTAAQLAHRRKEGAQLRFGAQELTENEKSMSAALEKVAEELGGQATLANVAISYVMHKQAYVFPIVGGKKVEHLKANIQALDIKLTPDQIDFLDGVVPFDLGFPHSLMGGDPALSRDGKSKISLLNQASRLTWVRAGQPLD